MLTTFRIMKSYVGLYKRLIFKIIIRKSNEKSIFSQKIPTSCIDKFFKVDKI